MSDILTVTLNPCVDVSTSTAQVVPTHKLRCAAPLREPGGGGVNVARVITRLGGDCRALYAAGGATGALLERLLAAEGVRSLRVPVAGDTRESLHVLDLGRNEEYRFVMPGPTLTEAEWQACLRQVADAVPRPRYLVLSGSLPPGVPPDFYARLVRLARDAGTRCVLDASGPPLAAALAVGVYLVKPSLRELSEWAGQALESETQWRAAARQLIVQKRAEVVVLSLGDKGALLVADQTELFAPSLPVPVVSAVGAGDSLVGGMVAALAAGAALPEAFRRGVAAATAALLVAGTRLGSAADAERLYGELVIS